MQENKTRIKEESFVSQKQVPLSQNIEPANDAYFIEQAMSDPVVKQTSDENRALYERFKPSIKKIIDRTSTSQLCFIKIKNKNFKKCGLGFEVYFE